MAAIGLLLGWVLLFLWTTHDSGLCNNRCPSDKACEARCYKRGICPSASQ
jgi:hypothetical protein